jgi:hypothetical protein
MIQHDMMLWDHGVPRPDGSFNPEQRPEADVNQFQSTAKMADQPMKLAFVFLTPTKCPNYRSRRLYMTTPADAVHGSHPAISLHERAGHADRRRVDPHYHQPTDLYSSYSDKDFRRASTPRRPPSVRGAAGRGRVKR